MINISLSLSENVIQIIDKKRGDISRSKFVSRLLEKSLEKKEFNYELKDITINKCIECDNSCPRNWIPSFTNHKNFCLCRCHSENKRTVSENNSNNHSEFYKDIRDKIEKMLISNNTNDEVKIAKKDIIQFEYSNKDDFEEQFLLPIYRDIEKSTGYCIDEIKSNLKDKIKYE